MLCSVLLPISSEQTFDISRDVGKGIPITERLRGRNSPMKNKNKSSFYLKVLYNTISISSFH